MTSPEAAAAWWVPPHARLAARLAQVLDLACRNLARLDALAEHWQEESADRVVRLRDKIATEAALLLLVARRVAPHPAGEEVARRCEELGRLLAPLIRTARLRDLLVTAPQTAATLGAGHVFLEAAGLPDDGFAALVTEALAQGFAATVERVPYRLMDQRWTWGLLPGAPPPTHADLLPHSILASRAHPLFMSQSDAYAATHAVMYLTDFGRTPLPAEGLDAAHVRALVEAGMAWHLGTEDFDLLVEFLLDAHCLKASRSAYAALAWHALERVWDELGFVPGPVFDAAHYRGLRGEAADAYAFQTMYHTNFVAGMLCAVALLEPEAADPPTEEGEGSRMERLLAHLFAIQGTKATPQAAWLRALPEAPPPDEALLPVLGDLVLIEAGRRQDWRCLAAALEDLHGWGVGPTPTMLQARWLLDRVRTRGPSPGG